jgi:hypothetical protein
MILGTVHLRTVNILKIWLSKLVLTRTYKTFICHFSHFSVRLADDSQYLQGNYIFLFGYVLCIVFRSEVSQVEFLKNNGRLAPLMTGVLKGLSHEMNLAFEDMHGQFYALIGDAASFLCVPMIL